MGAPRALSIALVLGLAWPAPSAAPTVDSAEAPSRVAVACDPGDPRAIELGCALAPTLDLGAVSILDATPSAPRPSRASAMSSALRGIEAAGVRTAAVPEPTSLALLALGLTGFALRRRAPRATRARPRRARALPDRPPR